MGLQLEFIVVRPVSLDWLDRLACLTEWAREMIRLEICMCVRASVCVWVGDGKRMDEFGEWMAGWHSD